jgi:hypothetical protein
VSARRQRLTVDELRRLAQARRDLDDPVVMAKAWDDPRDTRGGVRAAESMHETAPTIKCPRAVVVDKRDQPTGFAEGRCGGKHAVRFYKTDLDQSSPSLVPDSGRPGEEAAPVFAFNVTSSDPEVFYVVASTDHCDCSWHLSLKWSDSKRSDTYEINNGGKPFRTMAANGLPRYYTSLDKKILR